MSTIRLGTLSLLLVSSLSLALAAGGCKQEEAGAADDTSASADPGPAETDPGLADEGPADEGQPDPGPPDVVDEGPAALDEGQDPGEAPDAFPCGEEPAPCENQIGVCEGTVKPPELCVEGEWLPCGEAVYAAQRPTFQPAGETLCDAADNDCDGTEDEGLTDCRCGNGVCDPAEAVETCPCDCATCGDGVCSPCGEDPLTCPDDCCRSPEGTSECGDGYCIGFACGENPTICPEDCGTDCGNGTCEKGESPFSCAEDCKFKACGNHVCEGGEDPATCPQDCCYAPSGESRCGDGWCLGEVCGESPDNCPDDCSGLCGNGSCDSGEGPVTCPVDCGVICGNCQCEEVAGESYLTCPTDCGFCGDLVCSPCGNLREDPERCPGDCCVPSGLGDANCDGRDDDCDGLTDEDVCDDGNPCTSDDCDEIDGACTFTPIPGTCAASETIEQEVGGTVSDPQSGVEVQIPPGAISDGEPEVIVSITPARELEEEPVGAELTTGEELIVVSVFRFEPEGLEFEEPVAVTIPVFRGRLPAGEEVKVLLFDWRSRTWQRARTLDGTLIVGTVSEDGMKVSFETDHFSEYGLARPKECRVDCEGRVCGDDACKGSCGDCGEGQVCTTLGQCIEGCVNACEAGTTQCAGELVQRCEDFDGDGCLDWGDGKPCQRAHECKEGRCKRYCSDECVPVGATDCAEGGARVCGQHDVDICHEWSAPAPCSEGEICRGGACVAEEMPVDACLNDADMQLFKAIDEKDERRDDSCTLACARAHPEEGREATLACLSACAVSDITRMSDGGSLTEGCLLCFVLTDLCAVEKCWDECVEFEDPGSICSFCIQDRCRADQDLCTGTFMEPEEICGNGVDDDDNGEKDCADGRCRMHPDCQEACASDADCDQTGSCLAAVCNTDIARCDYRPKPDGSPCHGDLCSGEGQCIRGDCEGGEAAGLECDDGDVCTSDDCDSHRGCVHYPEEGKPCSDGDPCTTPDLCFGGRCEGGEARRCDDHDPCTADSCEEGQCVHVPACGEEEACLFGRCLPLEPCDAVADCQNDDPCTRGECLLGNCVHEPACDDGDPCTADQCAPIGGKPVCLNTPTDGLPCDDYNPCTVGDTCSEGECRHGEDKDCDDGNPCTEAYCSSDGGCVQGGVGCDDQDECTDDYCDAEAGGCVNEPKVCGSGKRCAQPLGWCVRDRVCESDADCPDEDACWVGACAPVEDGQKKCTVVPLCSDDGNPCTDVHCKGGGEGEPTCLTENKSSDHGCEDGDPCTEGEHCVEGTCSGGSPKHCDDGDPCTEDSCDPESGECAFGPGSCPEDEVCIREHGGCVPAEPCNPDTPEMCEDGDACTHDSCEHDNCFHYPACDDGDMCTVDACSAGVHGGAECTYAPAEPGAPCEDGDLCTEGDTCEGLGCVPGEPRDCDDGDACTKDLCHPDEGCRHDWLKCEDFNPCTDDSCDPGSGCVFDRDEERDGCGGGGYCDNPHDRTALDDLDRGLRETGLKIEAGRLCVLRCSEDLERHGADCMAECVREIAFTHAADSSAKPGEPCESCLIGYGRCIYDTCHVACRLFPDSGHGLCGDCLDRADCDGALDECAGFPVGVGGDCETLADCLGEEDVCVDTVCEHGYCRARPKDCDDRNPCTNDRCEASGDCVNEASPMCAFEAECLDNVDDDGDELVDCEDPDCAGGLDCAAPCAEDSECDDGDACTTGLCVLGRCVFDYLGTEGLRCGGDQCRGPGYCNRGQCVNPGSPTHCDDGNPCTADRCDPALGCVAEPDDSGGCDDGDACTADDRCFGGRCTPGRPEICEDDNACTTDRCEGDKGCVFEDACDDAQVCVEGGCHDLRSCSSVTDCEDGDPCTHDECAASGNCVRRPFCEDGDPCTSDRCTVSDMQPSCTFDPNEADDAPCDDGNPCTGDDRCSSGACAPGEPVPCDDDNPCSEDTCVDFEGCSRASLDCDDHKACTIDLCVAEDGGCQHQPVVCPEGLECSEPDGACVDTGGP